jgi:signal transduction histidine kinase
MRFALTSFLVFVLVGVAITYFRAADLREREEQAAMSRAELIADEMVSPLLTSRLLATPLTGERYATVNLVVDRAKSNDPGIERVKIWGLDGTILYADEASLVGNHPEPEEDLLEAIEEGEVESEISDLSGDENTAERGLADRLFETYVPVRETDGGPVVAVVEVYRDYAVIQAEIDRLTKTLAISLGAGLLVLYVLLLPVMVGATRTLRAQNDQLTTQAEQMSDLLGREQETVAELRELDRLRDDFVAASSHELRSPLTSILGYARLLRSSSGATDPVIMESADAIERQSSRMLRLVMNLLSESRIETDRSEGPVTPFNLGALVDEVAADFHGDGRRIRSGVGADLEVCCDRAKVTDVLVNLIDNALKYAPDSAVTVEAGVEEGTLTLSVADEGPGIDPGDIGRIFDRFYQADQSATRAHGGVGLGLHIVEGLVAAMHGRVRVDSVPGVGCTFIVELPLVHLSAPLGAAAGHA